MFALKITKKIRFLRFMSLFFGFKVVPFGNFGYFSRDKRNGDSEEDHRLSDAYAFLHNS